MARNGMKLKPIWFFVGLVLVSMGLVVLIAGIAQYAGGAPPSTALGHLHPAIWWGALMVAVGAVFVAGNWRKSVD